MAETADEKFIFEPTWNWLKKLKVPIAHPPFIQILLGVIIFPLEVALLALAAILFGLLYFIPTVVIAIVFYVPSLGHSGKLFKLLAFETWEDKDNKEKKTQ